MKEEAFLGDVLEAFLRDIGRDDILALGEIHRKWREIAGERLFEKSVPAALKENRLVVLAPAPAWSSEIHMMSPVLLKRIEEETGIKIDEIRVKTDKNLKNPR